MKSAVWSRIGAIERIREDIWRYITQAAQREDDVVLQASRLLQMSPADVTTLAQIHFVLSDEVGLMLEQMPLLIRRLSTTTVHEREASAERVRGSIVWGETFAVRAAVGLPHLFVTNPARRAFETPENLLLVFALDAVARFGRLTGWEDSTSQGIGEVVRARINDAVRWSRARALSDLEIRPPSPKTIARVRAGRRRPLYSGVLAVVELHQQMIARLNREAIRRSIENHALVTREDPVLLELLCVFLTMAVLKDQGWKRRQRGLVGGGRILSAERGGQALDLYFQHAPSGLSRGSLYRRVQTDHGFAGVGGLIPDLVVSLKNREGEQRWILIEVKGVRRSVSDSARAALYDLLAYRRAFAPALHSQAGVHGIGVAWGAEVEPAMDSEVLLCSPDTLGQAIEHAVSVQAGR